MITIASGVVGFVSGAALTYWLLKRQKRVNHIKNSWNRGYKVLGKKEKVGGYSRPTSRSSYTSRKSTYPKKDTERESNPPSMPDWF